MDQTKVAIHEIEVQVQTFAPSGLNKRSPFLEAEGEGAAGLEHGEDTHQPLVNAIALRQFPSRVLLSNRGSQILERAFILLGHGDRVVLDALGVVQQERLEAGALHIHTVEELRHRPAGHDRKVAAKQHAVKTGKHTVDASFVLADELLHDALPVLH
jgi:hypothetical protein